MRFIMAPGGALEGLRKLQSEGLVRYTGVATGTLAPLQIAIESGEFDVIQFPRLYTLPNQSAASSGLLAAARARNIGTLSAAPFGGAILATGTGVSEPLYTFAPALHQKCSPRCSGWKAAAPSSACPSPSRRWLTT
jgi:aryl-alcohol dehydrogenase-like predicted oxidoreductase